MLTNQKLPNRIIGKFTKYRLIGYFGAGMIKVAPKCEPQHAETNRQNYTNFKSNLAMMVIYLSVKSKFD